MAIPVDRRTVLPVRKRATEVSVVTARRSSPSRGRRRPPPRTVPVAGIVGLGHMGLVTGLAFSAHGLNVVGYDISPELGKQIARGSAPFAEEGLAKLLRQELSRGRFRVVPSLDALAAEAECLFLCVPTPSQPDGRINLGPLEQSARAVATALRSVTSPRVVVVKSTVVPGTTEGMVAPLVRSVAGKSPEEIGIASNPEFLSEGTVVRDALRPTRVVIGASDARSLAWLRRAYRDFGAPVHALSPSGAELVKYLSNSFLALKVSFANEAARLADRLGVHIDRVMEAVGSDPRIGGSFLRAGPGFGGSCFDKDVRALAVRSSDLGLGLKLPRAALDVNDDQLEYVIDRIDTSLGGLKGARLALLGLAFKAGTEDVRESRALPIAERLLERGATVRAHDPAAAKSFARAWSERTPKGAAGLTIVPSIEHAIEGADAAILQADWPQYLRWPARWSRKMRRPLLIDLRRAVPVEVARRAGLSLVGLGDGTDVKNVADVPRAAP